ncbi:hypothetical protein IMSAG049_00607 [Clostridiales bacterium]|nr:hypothetical protein IMSAG049_00607 [Clostridiales bacterium]
MLDKENIKEKLQSALPVDRYIHTLGVAEEAKKLALKYGGEELAEKAEYAGLLHDCAKGYPNEMKLRFAKEYHVPVDEIMKKQPDLIHSFLGAEVAKREYEVSDLEILEAIKWHTTGKKDMSLLEKIVFTADYIEPNRERFDGLEKAREIAYVNLDEAIHYILKCTIEYVKERNRLLHPYSVDALEYYSGLCDG